MMQRQQLQPLLLLQLLVTDGDDERDDDGPDDCGTVYMLLELRRTVMET